MLEVCSRSSTPVAGATVGDAEPDSEASAEGSVVGSLEVVAAVGGVEEPVPLGSSSSPPQPPRASRARTRQAAASLREGVLTSITVAKRRLPVSPFQGWGRKSRQPCSSRKDGVPSMLIADELRTIGL